MNSNFDNILSFEDGKLSDAEIFKLFNDLVESGDIWKLPESSRFNYLNIAANLIDSGMIKCGTKSPSLLN